eukprot:3090660-Pleurochrysis_carterae.AAC.3
MTKHGLTYTVLPCLGRCVLRSEPTLDKRFPVATRVFGRRWASPREEHDAARGALWCGQGCVLANARVSVA